MNSFAARPECLIRCGFLLALAAAGALAGVLAPYDPWAASGLPFSSPTWPHLLGTNDLGQDLLSEVVFGIRLSLAVGLIGAAVATAIGALVGLAAGFYRGWIDEALMGLTDTIMLIPALPLIILLVAYSGPNFWWIVAVIGLVWWTGTARAVRARVLQVREMPFVEASTALGARRWRTMLVHVLPNVGVSIAGALHYGCARSDSHRGRPQLSGSGRPIGKEPRINLESRLYKRWIDQRAVVVVPVSAHGYIRDSVERIAARNRLPSKPHIAPRLCRTIPTAPIFV